MDLTLLTSPSGRKASFSLNLGEDIFRVGQACRNDGIVRGEAALRLNDGDVVNEDVKLKSFTWTR